MFSVHKTCALGSVFDDWGNTRPRDDEADDIIKNVTTVRNDDPEGSVSVLYDVTLACSVIVWPGDLDSDEEFVSMREDNDRTYCVYCYKQIR